jgi:type IV pilus assembly protein PilE
MQTQPPSTDRKTLQGPARGFTLIELMIVVVVVALLAMVAMPSFLDSIRKGRRAEAFTAINRVQQAQERWRSSNAAFTAALTASSPAGLALPATTPSGYYTIAIPGATAYSYEVTATAISGTSQAKDADCAKLGVMLGDPAVPEAPANLRYAGAPLSGSLSYAATHKCWAR